MNLLLERSQTHINGLSLVPLRIGRGVVFKLGAELELDDEEERLMRTYDLANAVLVSSGLAEDIGKALRPALALGIAVFLLFWFLTNWAFALMVAILTAVTMTVVYFRALRERIVVRDLLNGGRSFYCESIVDLIQKEAFLEGAGEYLRQVLESAKHWDDREAVPIQPLDKAAAKLFVLRNSIG